MLTRRSKDYEGRSFIAFAKRLRKEEYTTELVTRSIEVMMESGCEEASQASLEWLMKKRKAFDRRGDMVVAAWAEQQQHEMNLRVHHLSRSKVGLNQLGI